MKEYNSHKYTLHKLASVTPSLAFSPDADFDSWKATAKDKLYELLGMGSFQKCDDDFSVVEDTIENEYRHIKFEFQSEEGYYVPCSLMLPLDIDKPLPCAVCLQGHSTGMHISMGIKKYEKDPEPENMPNAYALQAVRHGLAAIAFDQRYMGAAGGSETGHPACFSPENALSALMLGRTAHGERAWDVSRLLDVIEKHLTDYINPDRLILIGHSGGGTAAFYTGALEERFHMVVSSGAVCTYDASIMAMYHCCCNYIPHIREYFNMGDIGCIAAPRKFVQVNGTGDGIFPIGPAEECFAVIKSAYEKLGSPDNCAHVKGPDGHRFFPDEAWPVILEMLNR